MDARDQPDPDFQSGLYDPTIVVEDENWFVQQAGGWPADGRSPLERVRDVLLDHLVRLAIFAGAAAVLFAVLSMLR